MTHCVCSGVLSVPLRCSTPSRPLLASSLTFSSTSITYNLPSLSPYAIFSYLTLHGSKHPFHLHLEVLVSGVQLCWHLLPIWLLLLAVLISPRPSFPRNYTHSQDSTIRTEALKAWSAMIQSNASPPTGTSAIHQKNMDSPVIEGHFNSLLSGADSRGKTRLLA